MSDWTADRVATLKRLWSVKSAREIAGELGTARNAVIGKAWRLGLSVPTPALRKPRDTAPGRLDGCAWYEGDPTPENRCNGPCVSGKPYCAPHQKRVVQCLKALDKPKLVKAKVSRFDLMRMDGRG